MSLAIGVGIGLSLSRNALNDGSTGTPIPVDLAAATGSYSFPEGNHERADIATMQGFMALDGSGSFWNTDEAIFNAPGALFAIAELPYLRRKINREYGLIGSSKNAGRAVAMQLYGGADNNASNRDLFAAYVNGGLAGDLTIKSAECTEDAFLVVTYRSGADGAEEFATDWYSLIDGARYAGTPVSATGFDHLNNPGFDLGVGQISNTGVPAVPHSANVSSWPGHLQALGYVDGAIAPSVWASIALGEDIQTALEADSGVIKFLREFDGTAASLAASVVGDDTNTLTTVGDGLRPGSTVRRQSLASYVRLDPLAAGVVYGCLVDRLTTSVPVRGQSSGDVEVQIYDAVTGAIVVNWTAVTAAQLAAGSATITCPGRAGWMHMRARLAADTSVIYDMREHFGAGWRFGFWGQSQINIPLKSGDMTDGWDADDVFQMSYCGQDDTSPSANRPQSVRVHRLGQTTFADGLRGFYEQWKLYGDDWPVMIVNFAASGQSGEDVIGDTSKTNNFVWDRGVNFEDGPDVQSLADAVGDQFTAMGWCWHTSDANLGVNYGHLFDAFLTGETNVTITEVDHYWGDIAQTGYKFFINVGTARKTVDGDFEQAAPMNGAEMNAHLAQRAYALANGYMLGPHLSDYKVAYDGGGHVDVDDARASTRVGTRLAQGAARCLGFDTTTDPEFTSAQFTNGTRNVIVATIDLPNGGTLTAADVNEVVGFEVEVSGTHYAQHAASEGFNAVITDAAAGEVTLTKDTGSWVAGALISLYPEEATNYGFLGLDQDVVLDGLLYEVGGNVVGGDPGMPVARMFTTRVAVAEAG